MIYILYDRYQRKIIFTILDRKDCTVTMATGNIAPQLKKEKILMIKMLCSSSLLISGHIGH